MLQEELNSFTKEQRLTKLEEARKVTQVFNYAGIVLGVWVFIYPAPYLPACLIALVFPMLSLFPYYHYRPLIKLDNTSSQAYPNLIGALLLTPLLFGLRMFIDFKIVEYTNLWTPACIFAACYMAAIHLNSKAINTRSKRGLILSAYIAVMVMAYGSGVTIFYNCYYDKSAPQLYQVKVLAKTTSSTFFGTTYYINVGAWGPLERQKQYDVDEEIYKLTNEGDTIKFSLREGRLHAPWVEIKR